MSLIVLYLDTRYDVCECNSLRHMTISSFLWPLTFSLTFIVHKVTFIFIIRWTLYCCVLFPSTKFVGSVKFEIWTIVWRKLKWRHNDVITHSIFMKLNTNRPRVYLSDIPNFILIKHTRAKIYGRKVNHQELWRTIGYWVTWPWVVTLTLSQGQKGLWH